MLVVVALPPEVLLDADEVTGIMVEARPLRADEHRVLHLLVPLQQLRRHLVSPSMHRSESSNVFGVVKPPSHLDLLNQLIR